MSQVRVANPKEWTIRKLEAPTKGTRRAMDASERPDIPDEFLRTDAVSIAEIYEATPAPSAGDRRGATTPALELDVAVDPGSVKVLAVRHPSCALTFHTSAGPAEGRRSAGAAPAAMHFRIPVRRYDDGPERRGIITHALKVIVLKVAKAVLDKLAGMALSALAERWEQHRWKAQGLKEGWFRVEPSPGNPPTLKLTPATPPHDKVSLLLLHGTFSNADGAFRALSGTDFFRGIHPIYGENIYAFNHFTVSRTPEENARLLLGSLPDKAHSFDVITHSRGGLVLRTLVERSADLGPEAHRFTLRRAVLVASPNDGTPLATPTRWADTVGWLANLLEFFPANPFTTGASLVAEAIVWLAGHAAGDLPGLRSMDAAGNLVGLLQGPPGPPREAYSALVANFHPDSDLWKRMVDVGADQFFGSANDLVVPSEGGWRVDRDGTPYIPAGRIGCFGPGGNLGPADKGDVNHVNFFQQPETATFLMRALEGLPPGLPPVDLSRPLPDRRFTRSAATARPSGQAMIEATSPTPAPGAPPAESSLPMDGDQDAFHLVVMDMADGDPNPATARVFASYNGARVIASLRLRAAEDEPKTCFGTIIRYHQRIKNYTNGVKGTLPPDDEMLEFGGLMFETLLQGDVRRLYDEARARQQGRRLDMVFTSKIPWIAEKPWEFSYDTARASFLATEESHFVRNVLTAVPAECIPQVRGTLRILVASAQPIGFGRLSIDQEVQVIRRGFDPLVEAGLATVEVLPRATPATIHAHLQTGDYNVVHFIGHGTFDDDRQEGYLVFEDGAGGQFRLGQRSVREIFCRRGIGLVFLNSCQSGTGGLSDFNKGVAQALVAHGLPALVANQYSVLDASASSFAQHFYWSLGRGMTLGQAAREARVAVNYSLQGEAIDWAVPVVYARDPKRPLCAAPARRVQVPRAAAAEAKARRAPERETRVAVWDMDQVFPSLGTTLSRMNAAQQVFAFSLTDLSVPLDAWDLETKGLEGQRLLRAERLADRLCGKANDLGVNLLACVTRQPLGDADYPDLYAWWPEKQSPPVVIFSCASFDELAAEGPMTDRAIANVMVEALTGFYGNLDSHTRPSKNCPLYFNPRLELRYLTGKQEFDPQCRQIVQKLMPDKLDALEALLKVFQ